MKNKKMKKLIIISLFFLVSYQVYSQDVIHTLGTDGELIIKDESGTKFLTLRQSDGLLNIKKNIRLEDITGSQVGIIFKGNDRFLHNYAPSGAYGSNTFFGINSGNFDMSGIETYSSYNTGIGYSSLYSNTTGRFNTALGFNSLYSNTTGEFNTALGTNSLRINETGASNTAIGYNSLYYNSRGMFNTALGSNSLHNNRTGANNTAIGYNSLYNNKSNDNTAIGYNSLFSNNSGNYNTALGTNSLYSNSHGIENTAVGYESLYSNTIGQGNTAIGVKSLRFNSEGNCNIAIGDGSLFYNSTGDFNIAIGVNSLNLNTIGCDNTAVGLLSLYSNTEGFENTAVGYTSLTNNSTGRYNTAVGSESLYSNTTGEYNTAVGYKSLYSNTTDNNTAVGYKSLHSNSTGRGGNTALGNYSLYSNNTGYHNTAIGDSTLLLLTGSRSYNNTAIGFKSGITLTSGHNNTLIGNDAQTSSETVSHEITLGNRNVRTLRCNVTSISGLSDARDKKNISDLSLGLDFITRLNPRQFNWDNRDWYINKKSDGSKMEEKLTAGFIAQELDEVQQSENAEWLDLVYKSNPEKLEITTGNLLPVMVKAIQELNDKNESLEKEIVQLKNEIESFKTVNEKLVKLERLMMDMKENKIKVKEIKTSGN